MKTGRLVTIENLAYKVLAQARGRVTLRRHRRMALAEFKRRRRARRWRRLVSATFILDAVDGRTLSNYELLEMRLPYKYIERLHSTLPTVTGFGCYGTSTPLPARLRDA